MSSGFSSRSPVGGCEFAGNVKWSTQDYIDAHIAVVTSGKHNYQGCKIPIPTKIRYDRIKEALGNKISAKEHRVPLMRPRDGPPLLDTLFTLVHRPTGHTSPWSDCPLLHVTGGAVPVVRGGPVRIGRPQCPMLNGRCLCTGSDAEEV